MAAPVSGHATRTRHADSERTGMPPKSAATIRANSPFFKDDPDPKVIGARRIRRADTSFDWFALPGPLAPECAGR